MLALGLLLIAAMLFVSLRPAGSLDSLTEKAGGVPPGWMRLSFNLPCAVRSGDAASFYTALRSRDRSTLSTFLAQRKILMLQEGTAFRIVPASPIAKVSYGDLRSPDTCYIPSDLVATIERKGH